MRAHDDEVAELRRAGDAALRHDHAMAADEDVVGDLHEVVDLGALADDRVRKAPRSTVELAPISTSSPMSTRPICGTLTWPLALMAKPNPSCPMRTPGWMMTPLPIDGVRQCRAGADVAVAADHDPEADHGTGGNRRARADRGFAADDGAGLDNGALADPGGRMHQRTARVGAAGGGLAAQRVRVEQSQRQGERVVGRGRRQCGRGARRALGVGAGQDAGTGGRGDELRGILAVVEEGQMVAARVAQRPHVLDHARAIVVVRQDCTDFGGDVAQSERAGSVKKARMLHGFPLGADFVEGNLRMTPQLSAGAEEHDRRGPPATSLGERANITGNAHRSHHKLGSAARLCRAVTSILVTRSAILLQRNETAERRDSSLSLATRSNMSPLHFTLYCSSPASGGIRRTTSYWRPDVGIPGPGRRKVHQLTRF